MGFDPPSEWKCVTSSNDEVSDSSDELTCFHYANPTSNPIDATLLGSALLVDGVVQPHAKVPP